MRRLVNRSLRTPNSPRLPHTQVRAVDLLTEALATISTRPGRTVLTVLGSVLGVGALVASVGLTQTAANAAGTRFDAFAATSVVVNAATTAPGVVSDAIPWDAEERTRRLNGVIDAATITPVDTGGNLTRSSPLADPLTRNEISVDYVATSPGLPATVGADLAAGRYFDHGHSQRADPVVVLGPGAAHRLNVTSIQPGTTIHINDTTLRVIGILRDVADHDELLGAAIIPDGLARSLFGLEAPTHVAIRTEIGAAQLVGSQAPLAISPTHPEQLTTIIPPEPQAVREGVAADFSTLYIAIGIVTLVVGAIGIANVTLVSVLERIGEIGLRRALGARKRHIASQFLLESTLLGLLGGLIGSTIGLLVIVAVSWANTWIPITHTAIPIAAVALGALLGFMAGLYPAWRAASLEPVEALRAGT